MTSRPASPSRAQVRPVIDLDLGHAHQYGYRRPEHIPARRDERWSPPLLNPTRTPDQEATCSATTPTA